MAAMLSSSVGKSHKLERLFRSKQDISIGRHQDNALVLNSLISPEHLIPDSVVLQLSRRHARLAVKDGELQLYDNGTLNGTFINNLRIPEQTWRVLKNGDVISLGGTNPLELDGEVIDNPWTFKIKSPEEFLARYTAPSSLPNAETQPQTAPVRGQTQQAPREVYTFSTGQQTGRDTRPAPALPDEAEVIDLTNDSPPPPRATTAPRPKSASRKSNKSSSSQGPETKRARPTSADNKNQAPAAPAAAAAAAAAPPAAAGGDASGRVTKGIMEELTCPICQELVVAAYSLYPCGHIFCGVCIAGWLVNKQDCPNCRQRCTSAPTRQITIDNVVSMSIGNLNEMDKMVYTERKKEWEEQKAVLEPKILDPKKFAAANAAAAGANGYNRGGSRVVTAHQDPFVGMVPGMMPGMVGAGGGGGNIPGLGFLLQGLGRATREPPQTDYFAAARSMEHLHAAVQRSRNPSTSVRGSEQRFRCEYSGGAAERCKGCRQVPPQNSLILGVGRVSQTARGGAGNRTPGWEWYHFDCFPPAQFRNARVFGFEGMRNLSPPDAARIRERMVI